MAAGDKVYIADKETLDKVNATAFVVHTLIGNSNDTGGTANAGSVFGKLNALISSIASHIANWTAARAAKIDTISTDVAETKTNTAIDNNANATGTLSQKLSHLMGLLETVNTSAINGGKKLSGKVVNFTANTSGTFAILDIVGSGRFDFAYTTLGQASAPLTIVIDGVTLSYNNLVGYSWLAPSAYHAGSLLAAISSSNMNSNYMSSLSPLFFKQSLKIQVTINAAAEHYFRANYAMYE